MKIVERQPLVMNNIEINRRSLDGYVNATAMCKAGGKLFADFFRLERTHSVLQSLSTSMGIPIDLLVYTQKTEKNSQRGTYIHPQLAISLAMWISADFEVAVTDWILNGVVNYAKAKAKKQKPIRSPERQKATDATKSLNEVIMEKLCQEPQHIFIHVENSLHAGITGMSATHHKKVTGGSNSVDLINNIEQNIYSCAKNMLLEKLLTHENNSLTRSQIRDLAIDVRAFCESLVGNLENQGYLNNNRYLPLLPETRRKMHSLH